MSNENLKQDFSRRIRENYESFLNDWLSQETEELVSYAEEIAATKLLSQSVVEVATAEDMEFLMQFENPLEVVRDGWMNYEQADITNELQYALSYAKSNPSLWEDYAKSQEQAVISKSPTTVRELLEQHPNDRFDMMTPGGYVYLMPEEVRELLAGKSTMGNPGCSEFEMAITAEELLNQDILYAGFSDGEWKVSSGYSQAQRNPPGEKESLSAALKQEYEHLTQMWLTMTPEQLVQNAAEIAAVKDIYATFRSCDGETSAYLLSRQNALETVSKHFCKQRASELDTEVYHAIWDLTDEWLESISRAGMEGVTMC